MQLGHAGITHSWLGGEARYSCEGLKTQLAPSSYEKKTVKSSCDENSGWQWFGLDNRPVQHNVISKLTKIAYSPIVNLLQSSHVQVLSSCSSVCRLLWEFFWLTFSYMDYIILFPHTSLGIDSSWFTVGVTFFFSLTWVCAYKNMSLCKGTGHMETPRDELPPPTLWGQGIPCCLSHRAVPQATWPVSFHEFFSFCRRVGNPGVCCSIWLM